MYCNAKTIPKLLLLSCVFIASLATSALAPKDMRSIPSSGGIIYPTKIMHTTASHSFQGIELEYIAENFDSCFCFPQYFGSKVRDLKNLNPDFIALLYRNFRAIYETSSDEYQTALNNSWILRDSAGNIVRSTQWRQNVMVDIGNPDYQDYVVNLINQIVLQYDYDGVYFDNSFRVRTSSMWFGLTAQPINPRTKNRWTNYEIKQACIEVHNKLKVAIGPEKIDIANGIFDGKRFEERYHDYMDFFAQTSIDGTMGEGIWYAYDGQWYTTEKWSQGLDYLIWIQENFLNEKDKIFWIKCDLTVGSLPSHCTYNRMIDYAFASSLLGVSHNRGRNFILFFSAYDEGDLFLNDYVQSLLSTSIGKPLNSYYQVEGTDVFCRDFTNVKVLVNPTEYSYTVDLNEDFETLEGDVVSILDLPPHSGMILKRT